MIAKLIRAKNLKDKGGYNGHEGSGLMEVGRVESSRGRPRPTVFLASWENSGGRWGKR